MTGPARARAGVPEALALPFATPTRCGVAERIVAMAVGARDALHALALRLICAGAWSNDGCSLRSCSR